MTTKKLFLDALENQILLFDGAMGTEIQKYNPKPEDFPNNQDGFNDGLVLTHPEWIKQIHKNYLDAGADCIETNSFGSNKIKLDEYGYGDQTVEFNKKIAEIAVEACSKYTEKPRYAIGSMGPSGYLPSSNDPDLGQKPLDEIRDAFELQAQGLILGKVDALLIETSQDILEVKLVIEACHEAMEKTGKKIPIIANTTLDQYGKMLLGTNIQAAYTTISDMGIDVFGLNCSTGPIEMTPSVRWLDEQNEHNLLVVPNAGMPENQGGQAVYKMTPEKMGAALGDFLERFKKVRIIGGCCGTNPQHIAALRKVIDEKDNSVEG
ncbi:MAG: homocysteine S-methyltransferase family protein [Nitrosopumilus sp.]|nr:homocysteine S-methyltransferase family protein [Nitrosopumilus sp.]MDH3736900.1 homocysteine S-methyltransferase family protein [Nitrosopumilus sp.]MDH3823734.1 homocysteine S-methyltransferase family protein [Nitrosopumilus sp.]MDH3853117.1 homocysteine S-methyltransferase family protein [Nitrosopumilus sp.]